MIPSGERMGGKAEFGRLDSSGWIKQKFCNIYIYIHKKPSLQLCGENESRKIVYVGINACQT